MKAYASNHKTESQGKEKFFYLLLIFLGMMGLFTLWTYKSLLHPLPYYFRYYDPEMPYFMNSLLLLKGETPPFILHPGIPVLLLGALIAWVQSMFLDVPSGTIIEWYLKHPEIYFNAARWVPLIFTLGVLGCLIRYFFRRRNFAAGAAMPLLYFLNPAALEHLVVWSPDTFAFAFGGLFLMAFHRIFFSNNPITSLKIYGLGFGLGTIISLKVYFLPWYLGVIGAVVFYQFVTGRKFKNFLESVVRITSGTCLGFLFWSILFSKYYLSTAGFLLRRSRVSSLIEKILPGFLPSALVLESKPFSLTQIAARFSAMIGEAPFFFLITLTIGSLLVLGIFRMFKKKERTTEVAFAVGLLLNSIFGLMITIGQPAHLRYLLPFSVNCLFQLALIFHWKVIPGLQRALVRGIIMGILLLLFINQMAADVTGHREMLNLCEMQQGALSKNIPKVIGEKELIRLWSYRVPSIPYSLLFGNSYCRGKFSKEIDEILPNDYEFSLGERVIFHNKQRVNLKDFKWDVLITEEWMLMHPNFKILSALSTQNPCFKDPSGIVFIYNKSSENIPPM